MTVKTDDKFNEMRNEIFNFNFFLMITSTAWCKYNADILWMALAHCFCCIDLCYIESKHFNAQTLCIFNHIQLLMCFPASIEISTAIHHCFVLMRVDGYSVGIITRVH